MLATVKSGEKLLEIDKVDGEYLILTNKIDDILFVHRILYLLTYHADVFAAFYATTIYDTDDEKMLIINNFESEIDKYSISAVEVESTDERHDWAFYNVREWYGDFAIGEGCNISYYLGYTYLFKELDRNEDKVIISIDKDYEKFIDITNHGDSYYVMLSCKHKIEFIIAIKENLYKYGNIFAAYVRTIDNSLPYPKIEDKVYCFAEIVETLDIRVINIHSSSKENADKWGGFNIQEIYQSSSVSLYGDYIYIFSPPVQYG